MYLDGRQEVEGQKKPMYCDVLRRTRSKLRLSLGFVWTSDRSCAVYWRVGKSRERTAGEIMDKNKV